MNIEKPILYEYSANRLTLLLTDPRADLPLQPCSAQREGTGPHSELSEEKGRGLQAA